MNLYRREKHTGWWEITHKLDNNLAVVRQYPVTSALPEVVYLSELNPPTLPQLIQSGGGTKVEVWYAKCVNTMLSNHNDLKATHVKLGDLWWNKDIELLFWELQGENYSKNGEANTLIHSVGTDHTSMSVGDVFILPDLRIGMTCGGMGWSFFQC